MGFLKKKRNLVLQITGNQYILLATLGSWNLGTGRNHVPVHLTSHPDPWDIGRKKHMKKHGGAPSPVISRVRVNCTSLTRVI